MSHRDKLRMCLRDTKIIGFYRNGVEIKKETYVIGDKKMWEDMKVWDAVDGQTSRFLK